MINLKELQEYADRYQSLPARPLKITAKFASTPAGYDFPHLDNILARAVIIEATQGKGIPPSDEPYYLPIPCMREWVHSSGVPLWRTTDFIPVGLNEKEAAYWHKRKIHPHFVSRKKGKHINVRGTEGADKEYRIPLPRNTSNEWVAYCHGNMDEIGRLLCRVYSIGKKISQGHGALLSYSIEPIAEFSFFKDDCSLRPLPMGVLDIIGDAYLQGWTPPYWLPATQSQCFPTNGLIVRTYNKNLHQTKTAGGKG